MVKHIVLFKFKDENKIENIKKAKELFEELGQKINELKSVEVGINFDTAPRATDMSIYTTFDDIEGLHSYAIDPIHLEVVEFIKGVTEYTKVCDYYL
jgi:hypothetical protein